MLGLMQEHPLVISSLIDFVEREHPEQEIVTRTGERSEDRHRITYAELADRARRLAAALHRLDIGLGDRVATLAWNTHRHLEIFYGVSGVGAVCHTINPRLFAEQVAFMINEAEDKLLLVDLDLLPVVEAVAPALNHLPPIVVLAPQDQLPASLPVASANLLSYETLLAESAPSFAWPALDERTAAVLCYTSGTTGKPKGVLYSHRAILLHTYAACMKDALGFGAADTVMPVVPMFHVMAWGIPYAAAAVGCKLVLPGRYLDAPSLCDLIIEEGVNFAAGVSTIWLNLVHHLEATGTRLPSMERILCGGSPVARTTVQEFAEHADVKVVHAWGMTELSPIAGVNSPKRGTARYPSPAYFELQKKQGRALFGIDIKTVDEAGRMLPRDGTTSGFIKTRGHWVIEEYFRHAGEGTVDADRWFDTGDVGTIDEHGYLLITDRTKDMIKSGGEWISSIELENLAVSHPAIAEAAVIAVKHPRWVERPLLLCVKQPSAEASREDILAFYDGKVAKWWIPDDVLFVDSLPYTATGKLFKSELRKQYADYEITGR